MRTLPTLLSLTFAFTTGCGDDDAKEPADDGNVRIEGTEPGDCDDDADNDADGLFDPIREHRDFCPFVVPPAQVDDTASKVPSEPGYKYILNAIAP